MVTFLFCFYLYVFFFVFFLFLFFIFVLPQKCRLLQLLCSVTYKVSAVELVIHLNECLCVLQTLAFSFQKAFWLISNHYAIVIASLSLYSLTITGVVTFIAFILFITIFFWAILKRNVGSQASQQFSFLSLTNFLFFSISWLPLDFFCLNSMQSCFLPFFFLFYYYTRIPYGHTQRHNRKSVAILLCNWYFCWFGPFSLARFRFQNAC